MTLDEIAAVEAEWIGRVPSADQSCFGWEPYSPAIFSDLLVECLPHVGNLTFLDVGCGIGTKCEIAVNAGFAAFGIDISADLISEATRFAINIELADARAWRGYGQFGLVYINHPLISQDEEEVLERYIQTMMAPGSVLLAVNYDVAPDWPEIARLGEWNAAWVKS